MKKELKQPEPEGDWEARFDEKFQVDASTYMPLYTNEELKDFIRNLLASSRSKLIGEIREKIEEMKIKDPVKCGVEDGDTFEPLYYGDGYNEAIEEILLLEEFVGKK